MDLKKSDPVIFLSDIYFSKSLVIL